MDVRKMQEVYAFNKLKLRQIYSSVPLSVACRCFACNCFENFTEIAIIMIACKFCNFRNGNLGIYQHG